MEYNREDQYSLDRLINRTNAAEGTSLPPQQRGFTRVPYVSSVKVSSPSLEKYLISWIEPEGFVGKIAGYNVYYTVSGQNKPPVFLSAAQGSPLMIQIPAISDARLTFFVQTQLTNGFVNKPENSPSAAISVLPVIKTVTTAYTCGSFDTFVLVDTTAGDVTVTLPPAPATNQQIRFKKTVAANNMIISGNGHNIDGAATLSVSVRYTAFILIFYNGEWRIV